MTERQLLAYVILAIAVTCITAAILWTTVLRKRLEQRRRRKQRQLQRAAVEALARTVPTSI